MGLLSERLERAHPGVEFSVDWTPELLHITYRPPDRSKHTSGTWQIDMDVWGDVIHEAVRTPAPSTRNLRLSTFDANGWAVMEECRWELYEELEKVTTPHPSRSAASPPLDR
ncbi:MAG: hypothetical protein FJX74_24385 [Armatimonadetes bacterium]|nr:hypothetical protein [Armatimonadota bacterium]